MRTLLLGMGNPILSDDAVGVRLARDFKRELEGFRELDVFEDCSVGGLNLLDIFTGYPRAVVLDSIRTTEGIPGDWYYFTAEALRETVHLSNLHDANFATAMEMGRALGLSLPLSNDIHIFAVEAKENRTFSEQMSPELETAYCRYAPGILGEIRKLLQT